jgi:hypothetical protein
LVAVFDRPKVAVRRVDVGARPVRPRAQAGGLQLPAIAVLGAPAQRGGMHTCLTDKWTGFLLVSFLAALPLRAATGAEKEGESKGKAKAEEKKQLVIKSGPIDVLPNAEERVRWEGRYNIDLNPSTPEDVARLLVRTRAGLGLRWKPITAYAEAMDARELFDPFETRIDQNVIDLHQLYLLIEKPWEVPLGLKVGRQEMVLGSKMLVNSSQWSNNPRVWDQVRLWAVEEKSWRVDTFLGKPITVTDHEIDRWKAGENFWGVFGTAKVASPLSFDLYLYGLADQVSSGTKPIVGENGVPGTSIRYTPGFRLFGGAFDGALSYTADFAFQLGHRADDDIRAFGTNVWVTGKQKDWQLTPSLELQFNLATGDHNPTDGVAGTFNPLFGVTHEPYGLADLFRLQNMMEAAALLRATLYPGLTFRAEYHSFWLNSTRDNWVNSNGAVIRKGQPGDLPNHAGQEIDFQLAYQPWKPLKLEADFCWFYPGAFARDTGSDKYARVIYLMATIGI